MAARRRGPAPRRAVLLAAAVLAGGAAEGGGDPRRESEAQSSRRRGLARAEADFEAEFGALAAPLLCSGCRLAGARLGLELDARNATGRPADSDGATVAAVYREAQAAANAACSGFPERMVVRPGAGGPIFEAEEVGASGGAAAEGSSARAGRLARQLCATLLEEFRVHIRRGRMGAL
ncbi:unnamed protein product [Prorocentrum cordatum]|uniref:Uncharacterized protein n=1 Tax=Prorocentrum cordatum TaxID=2364126 RepID=A0ABN9S8T4_9DINO|nr:unnamed protein product [Polarella glacialis]